MNRKLILSALVAGSAPFASYGETTNEVVVTATRIETPIEQIGSSIAVIDADAIESRQAKNAQDVLLQTAGIQITRSGGPGTAASTFIRGANANHTLVLINGIRVNSNTTGDFNLSNIPTESIERIEVLKGAQSAIYGADAIGGVINIITKKGEKHPLSGSASVAIGEKEFSEEVLTLSGGNDSFDFMSTLSYSELNGYDIADNKQNNGRENDPYRRLSFYTDLGANFLEDGRADLTVLYNKNSTELDNTSTNWFAGEYWQVDDQDRDTENEEWVVGLNLSKPLSERYTQSLRAGYSQMETEGRNDGAREYLFKTSHYELTLQSDVTVMDNDTLSFGYEGRRFEAQNDGNYREESTAQNSFFANNLLNLDDTLFLTLGTRYDHYSDFDSEVTWNAAASWFALDNTRIHGNIGTGYKVPTMNDLYWPADLYSAGNPDLKPEKSQSFDIGVEQTLLEEKLVADTTFFKSKIKDMINWAEMPAGSWFYTPSNVNEAEIKGVELSLTATPTEHLTTKAFYTFTDAEDSSTGNDLARRARHTGGLSANWEYRERGNFYADYSYTGKRFDNESNTRELKSFGLVNVGTRYRFTDHVSVFANVENLFDKEYELAAGYGTVGRVASIGLKGEF